MMGNDGKRKRLMANDGVMRENEGNFRQMMENDGINLLVLTYIEISIFQILSIITALYPKYE